MTLDSPLVVPALAPLTPQDQPRQTTTTNARSFLCAPLPDVAYCNGDPALALTPGTQSGNSTLTPILHAHKAHPATPPVTSRTSDGTSRDPVFETPADSEKPLRPPRAPPY